jgi:hypothetical protein
VEIPNDDVVGEAARHGPYVVHRGRRQRDQQPVLLNPLIRVPPRERDNDGLCHEFELSGTLEVAGAPRAYELIRGVATTCLVLED